MQVRPSRSHPEQRSGRGSDLFRQLSGDRRRALDRRRVLVEQRAVLQAPDVDRLVGAAAGDRLFVRADGPDALPFVRDGDPERRASRAATAIGFIQMMITYTSANSPLPRAIDAADVGNTAAFLLSPLARAITGSVVYVDNGYHAMGMAVPEGA